MLTGSDSDPKEKNDIRMPRTEIVSEPFHPDNKNHPGEERAKLFQDEVLIKEFYIPVHLWEAFHAAVKADMEKFPHLKKIKAKGPKAKASGTKMPGTTAPEAMAAIIYDQMKKKVLQDTDLILDNRFKLKIKELREKDNKELEEKRMREEARQAAGKKELERASDSQEYYCSLSPRTPSSPLVFSPSSQSQRGANVDDMNPPSSTEKQPVAQRTVSQRAHGLGETEDSKQAPTASAQQTVPAVPTVLETRKRVRDKTETGAEPEAKSGARPLKKLTTSSIWEGRRGRGAKNPNHPSGNSDSSLKQDLTKTVPATPPRLQL